MEQQLKETGKHFQIVVETGPDAVISIDNRHNIILWNKEAETLFGYSTNEAVGRPLYFIMPKRFRKACQEGINRAFSAGQSKVIRKAMERVGLRKDGREFPLEFSLSVWQLNGNFFCTGVFRDCSQRKQAEKETRLLQTIIQEITEAEDFYQALQVVLQRVCQTTGWVFGEAWIPNDAGNLLECGPAWYNSAGNLEEFRKKSGQATFLPGQGLPGRVWVSKRPEWPQVVSPGPDDVSPELEDAFPRARIAVEAGLKAGFGIPVLIDNQVLAVLVFFSLETRQEDKRLVEMVSTIAAQLSRVIQRKQFEARIQKLSNALEQITDTIIITDYEGVIEYVNPAFEQMTGYSRQEALGQTPRLLKSGRHKPEFYNNLWAAICAGKTFYAVFINRKKNGEIYYDDRSITPLKDNRGNITHFIATGRDITQRLLTRQALQKSNDRLAEAQRIARLGHWEWDIATGALDWSDEVYRVFGLSPQEITPTYNTFLNAVHPQDREFVKQAVNKTLSQAEPYRLDHRIIQPDGSERVVHSQAEVTSDKSGQPARLAGVVQDITQRKRLEERLAAIYRLGQELILLRDEADIIGRVLKTAAGVINFDAAGCGLVDKTAGELDYCYRRVGGLTAPAKMRLPLDAGQARGIGPAVIRSGRALYIPDVTREPRYVPPPNAPDVRSVLCVPIKVKKRGIGVLNIESAAPDHFSPDDRQLLQTLADQTAAALENLRLYADIKRHTEKLSVLNALSKVITSTLELDAILEKTLAGVKTLLDAEGSSILLRDPAGNNLTFAAAAGPGIEKMIGRPVPLEASIAGLALQNRESILIEDARQDPRFYSRIDAITGLTTRSLIAAPLIFKENKLGVIEVVNKSGGNFSLYDLEILETLAGSTALAIDRANLFKTERRQREIAETLSQVAVVVNSSLDVNKVLDRTLAELEKVIPYDSASVLLLEGDTLRVAAARGFTDPEAVTSLSIPLAGIPTALKVIRQQQPILIPDARQEPLFDATIPGAAPIRCVISSPLIRRGETVGLLNIDSWTPRRYSEQDAAVALRFAQHAAVAIENARLYKVTREQYRHLQQSQAKLIQTEKMSALGRLVGSIAHEINNPIQAVQNCVSLLQDEARGRQRPEKLTLYSKIAGTELDRIAAIVRRMRDFYRPSAREKQASFPDADSIDDFYRLDPEELQTVDLHIILEEVLQLTGKQLQHHKIKVEHAWSDELPPVRGSPDHLKQVFLNLILNADDAMPERGGGLYLRTALDQIELAGGKAQPAARIEFRDTGTGIAPDILPKIFEPLLTTKTQGTGLGLFISYKIIRAHRGEITVKSREDKGTTFTIRLPLKQPETGSGQS